MVIQLATMLLLSISTQNPKLDEIFRARPSPLSPARPEPLFSDARAVLWEHCPVIGFCVDLMFGDAEYGSVILAFGSPNEVAMTVKGSALFYLSERVVFYLDSGGYVSDIEIDLWKSKHWTREYFAGMLWKFRQK